MTHAEIPVPDDVRELAEALVTEFFPNSGGEERWGLIEGFSRGLLADRSRRPSSDEALGTPSAQWRKEGKPDPFSGQHYDLERSHLCRGDLTDDALANEVYLDPNIGNLTAAKERIRWLSRHIETALAALASAPSDEAGKLREALVRYNLATGKCLMAGGKIDKGDDTEWWKALVEAQQYGGSLLTPAELERARNALTPTGETE